MQDNINVNINNPQIYIQNTEGDIYKNTLPQSEMVDAIKLPDGLSEDELVEFSEFNSEFSRSQEEINLLIQEYTSEMNEYFRYQAELIELKRRYSQIQNRILISDNEDEKARLQKEASSIDAKISTVNDNIEASNYTLNDINAQIYSAMCDSIAQNTESTMAGSAKTANVQTYAGGLTSLGVQNSGEKFTTQNVNYTGNTIPKDLAARLDSRLGKGFSQKCEQVASKLGCNTGDLLAMMYSESGLKTNARNKSSNAVGLIQFIPSTLSGNGYTTEQVASMSAVEQLDVVADIFMKAKKMAGYGANERIDGGTLYAINWLPAYAKKNTLATQGGKYYSRGLDMNKDGSVTKNDLSQRLQAKYSEMINNI